MELLFDAKCTLGEGPCWDEGIARLVFVDIEEKGVHVYDPGTGHDEFIHVGDYVGAAVPRESGGLVLALSHGFYHLDLESRKLSLIGEAEPGVSYNRFNDGKCDAAGRFWAGTMNRDESARTGSLYCLETDLSIRRVITDVGVSNGLGWSPDNKTMYYIDTSTQTVVAYDFELSTGEIDNRRVVVEITEGSPDGMSVDAEGMLWIAHWDGWRISRWDPNRGTLLQEWMLPVARVTSCAFGPQLASGESPLYITTARSRLSSVDLANQPHAGSLFRLTVSTKGQPTYSFRG